MISNGYINFITQSGGGFVNGNPVAPADVVSDDIWCNIRVNSPALQLSIGGKYTAVDMSVTVDSDKFIEGSDVVDIKDIRGVSKGRFVVVSVEPMNMIKSVKLMLANA